ncbi:recombination repair protein 1 [Toxorhynchites rutilus septentrionalis]|uniref:recombination repair protein 1 n=1 Tax=Toxorhynchites rutilus septentrionalis TaxID=329112 RepID=UPI002478419D|nr:recombination repair protein 1 [Toxorhynchites rutilus septentrionalis]XP_055641950.1 recombination repair protein 1 [Toxorhynchites rutilus septentrionalis]
MESKGKRGRAAKKVAAEAEVSAETNNVEHEPLKNGGAKKKAAKGKLAKEVHVVEPVDLLEQPQEEKKKPGRKAKTAPAETDPLDVAPVESEEPAKGRKGRKPTAVKEDTPIEEPPAKKGRGRKPAAKESEDTDQVPEVSSKKGKSVENGIVSPAKQATTSKAKGRGKAAKEVVEPEPEQETVAPAPAKRGRGKARVESKEEDVEPSPVKKTKQTPKESPAKKTSPKKQAAVVEEPENEELEESAPAPKAGGRGRKKAAPAVEKPVSPAAAPMKRGRGRKAAADPEVNGAGKKVPKKSSKKTIPENEEPDEPDVPLNGVTQRKKKKTEDVEPTLEESTAKKSKAAKKPAAVKVNKSATDYPKLSFELEGKDFNYKISSWNVAGLRGWVEKGGLQYVEHEMPDILCLQETKCTEDQLPDEARHIKGYLPYWLCKPGGYAGVAIYSKKMPINVVYGLGDDEQDADGRLLTAEYEKFYLICVYVPNAGRKLVTLPKRLRWNEKFHQYLKDLDSKKPVIICGDMNVAHEEIDLANPKTNKKNAGFTQEERDGMTSLLSMGFVDTFRRLYPDQKSAYTFWTYMGNARAKNVGWRLDYFIASERLQGKIVDNVIRTGVYGSDHCPITLFLSL